MKRIIIDTKQTHFIGCWNLENNDLCKKITDFFENNANLQIQGTTAKGVDLKKKKTIDIPINPKSLNDPKFEIFKLYIGELFNCFSDYKVQWPFLKTMLHKVDVPGFNVQKYSRGDHFALEHCERATIGSIHRLFAWMTYLNDVDDGGYTSFGHYGIKIKPEIGKTLIWPAEWTHMHSGEILKSGTKYIITGWIHFANE